ncbi:MAG: Coenzyme F420 hydrogenase/dehydrogenase, beta subunit C-terminal domain [Bacteroidales bacterium]|nr:Coenzyme F420 hydrogenase/dehydrogenase, beta subunit C-terminal domain [Bacteroidales bacterium]
MENKSKVIDLVVNNDLCVGCGLCVYKCPNNAIEMRWNKIGFLVPMPSNKCDLDGSCLTVCPFNPFPQNNVRTEKELSDHFLPNAKSFDPQIGRYIAIYAGYSNKFRITSSSGGIATYVMTELLDRHTVKYVVSVKETKNPFAPYVYALCNNKQEVLSSSKTKYFPVTLSNVLTQLSKLDGTVAIVGTACFIKAIRLAQYEDQTLKNKIVFIVGIICGGQKSRFFSEYLIRKAGGTLDHCSELQYRVKDLSSSASDYSFSCYDQTFKHQKEIKMRYVGDMWGTGLFKANACDFCDDVTTELADISLGDAWIEPYVSDGYGTNVIVTRSTLAHEIIHQGMINGSLSVRDLELEQLLISQRGSFNHRQKGLGYRIRHAKKRGIIIPPKRHDKESIPFYFKLVQKKRMQVRKASLELWSRMPKTETFDRRIRDKLTCLRIRTKVYHYLEKIHKILMSSLL